MSRIITLLFALCWVAVPYATADWLAVGVMWESVGSIVDAGAVNAIYTDLNGLTETGSQTWSQASSGIAGAAEEYDHFGQTLVTGDFNGDGRVDLAIGTADEAIGETAWAGAVNVIYASSDGQLDAAGNQMFYQGYNGLIGLAEFKDSFGWSLASGDFNNDGYDDLAIGSPWESSVYSESGIAHVLYGSASGLLIFGQQIFSEAVTGMQGSEESGDLFAYSLVAGDFNGDGFADLAAGIPRETTSGYSESGAVSIIYGSIDGLSVVGNDYYTEPLLGPIPYAWFGETLTAGDIDGDGRDELVVGIPHQPFWGDLNAGAVAIFNSNAAYQYLYQGASIPSGVIEGHWQSNYYFGISLTVGDFNGDGFGDLAVGVSGQIVDEAEAAGAAHVFYGSLSGASAANDEIWSQGTDGVEGFADVGDQFGKSLEAGYIDGDGYDDLIIGVPGEEFYSTPEDCGAVGVIFGSAGGLTSSGSELFLQEHLTTDPSEFGDWFGNALAVGRSISNTIFSDDFEFGNWSRWSDVMP